MRKIDTIVIHCSATPEGRAVSVPTIRKWHTDPKPKGRGWSDIGYHYVIGLNGEIWPGRPIERKGAHVGGHNTGSIGICYVGGVTNDGRLRPKDTRTPAQKTALISLIRGLLTDFPQIQRICGHRDFRGVKKACPCFDAIPEYARLLEVAPVPLPKPQLDMPTYEAPDEATKPCFEPDDIDDREIIIPQQLEKPQIKTVSFWERAFQVVAGGGLVSLAPYLQDWRIVSGIGGTVVALAIIGTISQGRLIKSIRAIRDATS